MLDLRVLDFAAEDAWSWQLTDHDGGLLARHNVQLDRNSVEFRLATDLYRNLWMLDAEPTLLRRSEQDLLARLAGLADEGYNSRHIAETLNAGGYRPPKRTTVFIGKHGIRKYAKGRPLSSRT